MSGGLSIHCVDVASGRVAAGLPVVVKVARYPAADVEQLLDNERHGSAYSRWGRGQAITPA